MRKLRNAVWVVVLAPLVALANGVTTPVAVADSQPAPAVAQTEPAAEEAAAPAAEVKPEATAKKKATVAEKRADSKLANAVQALTPEELAKQSGFAVAVSLGHELGLGTFVSVQSYAYLGASLSIAPRYNFTFMEKRLVASGTIGMSYEYTLPDSETGRRVSPSDLRLGLSAPAFFREPLTGIGVTPSASLTLPVRPESFNAGLITSIRVGVGASRSVGNFDFSLGLSGSRGVYASSANLWRPGNPNERDSQGNLIWLCRPGEVACGGGGNNPAWSLGFNAGVNYRVTGDFVVSVGYGLSKSWKSPSTLTVDDFTSKALDSNGNPVARAELGQSDMMTSGIGASYQLNSHYSIDFGISTGMPPLTATGQVRFPFFGIGNMADNVTTAQFSISAGY